MFAIIQGLYILREDEGEELERQRKERERRNKKKNKRSGSGKGSGSGGYLKREKTLEEKLEEQTEKSLNW